MRIHLGVGDITLNGVGCPRKGISRRPEPAGARGCPARSRRMMRRFVCNLLSVSFAILSEIRSKANDCACIPVTAVVNAPKIPIINFSLPLTRSRLGTGRDLNCHPSSKLDATIFIVVFLMVTEEPRATVTNCSGKSCRLAAEIAGHREQNLCLQRTRPSQ